MKKKAIYSLLFIVLMISSSNSFSPFENDQNNLQQDENRLKNISNINHKTNKVTLSSSPILIDGNSDFDAQAKTNGWPGNGSATNPYIIENLDITTSTAYTHAIRISNTDVHFIIQNTSLSTSSDYSCGLSLLYVQHALILNNVANNTARCGFSLFRSSNNSLINNTATNNIDLSSTASSAGHGFQLSGNSYNNTLINNRADSNSGDGFYIDASHNNTLINNSASWNARNGFYIGSVNTTMINNFAESNTESGIYVSTHNNILINNTMINGGLDIVCSCRQTKVEDNTVNGLALIYWQDITNQYVPDHAGQIILVNSSFITVQNQIITNASTAIQLIDSHNNSLSNNTVNFNAGSGFSIIKSNNNTLSNNTASYNVGSGFNILGSNDNWLDNNTVIGNLDSGFRLNGINNSITSNYIGDHLDYGIYISRLFFSYPNTNSIIGNTFFNNRNSNGPTQAYSDSFEQNTNIFAQNFWSDHLEPDANGDQIVDTAYQIDGGCKCEDSAPVTTPYHATPPLILLTSPTASVYNNNVVILTYRIYGSGSVTIYIDNVVNTTILASDSEINDLQDGFHNISIISVDGTGATAIKEVLFTIDTGLLDVELGTYDFTYIIDGSSFSGSTTISETQLFGTYINNFGTFTDITKIIYSDMELTRSTGSLSITNFSSFWDEDHQWIVYSTASFSLRDSEYFDLDFTFEEEYSLPNVTESDVELIEEYTGRYREWKNYLYKNEWITYQYKDVTTYVSENLRKVPVQGGTIEGFNLRINQYTDEEYTGYDLIWVTPEGDLIKSESYDTNNNLVISMLAESITGVTITPKSTAVRSTSSTTTTSAVTNTAVPTFYLLLPLVCVSLIGLYRKKKIKK